MQALGASVLVTSLRLRSFLFAGGLLFVLQVWHTVGTHDRFLPSSLVVVGFLTTRFQTVYCQQTAV